ncbi:MAG: TolC family protein [Candidatus Omnitrophica bacterium]|nr:TolC family protein [Candidatus Omnitrophota bacterium]
MATVSLVYPSFAQATNRTIQSIRVYGTPEGAAIEILSDGPLPFVTYTLNDPPQLVLDLVEEQVESHVPEEAALGGDLVEGWKIFWDRQEGQLGWVDYLKFDLAGPAEHLVESVPGKLLIRVRPERADNQMARYAAEEYVESLLSSSPEHLLAYPQPQGVDGLPVLAAVKPDFSDTPESAGLLWGLEKAIQFGLSRHRPIRVAEEEMKLAKMRVREARRALYPSARIQSTWTNGTTSQIDFNEVQHGLQLEHPLFSSGQLVNVYKQALLNLQVAEKRRRKAEADYIPDLTSAYFQLIGAQAAVGYQENLIKQVRETFELGRRRYEKGLLTKLEMLNMEAQLNQIMFQKATVDSDVALARLKFLQQLKLEEGAVVEVPSQFPEYTPAAVDLEEALQLAARFRPDIQINTLLVQFNEYEERIRKSQGDLRVDLTAFIGLSGAAFETEDMTLAEDYSFGLRATKAWGPNELVYSNTTTKTSPRLGQSTRTDSTVNQYEIGLLDRTVLEGMSQAQQAVVGLERAKQELEDARSQVFQEVEEAYISYKRASLQLEYAQEKIHFRKEQLTIVKAQMDLNEALPSQLVEAMIRLNEEYISRGVALTNYYVALARLSRAVGLPGHYK